MFIAQEREVLKARDAFVVAHECGHNLGLRHADYLGQAYEDDSCIMGLSAGVRRFNAPHLDHMGWESHRASVTSQGTIDLDPIGYGVVSADPVMLKLPRYLGG